VASLCQILDATLTVQGGVVAIAVVVDRPLAGRASTVPPASG
jgi:hypothetical protein